MPEQVPVHVARERNRVLRELAARKQRAFQLSFMGRRLSALTLPRFDGFRTEALTDNYLKLMVTGEHAENAALTVLVDGVDQSELRGHVEVLSLTSPNC